MGKEMKFVKGLKIVAASLVRTISRLRISSLILVGLVGMSVTVRADPMFEILYEADTDTTTNEVVVNTFDSFNDVINYNYASHIVDVDISAPYTSTGLMYDGSKYHILYETDSDTTTNELVMNSFDSFADLINYNYTSTIIDVDISAGYSSTGITYDGSKYHILYEADTDTTTNEVVVNSFDSFNDIINYNYQSTIVDVDISAGYTSTGLTYDGSKYHILYEADTDTTTNEVVVNSFNSFNDLINYNYQSSIVDVDISSGYSSTGFNALYSTVPPPTLPPPPTSVPEPGTIALLGIGLIGIGLTRRRRKI